MRISEVLARNLKLLRKANGLSQAKLAERAGVSDKAIQYIEYQARWPGTDTIAAIAEALGVPELALFSAKPQTLDIKPRLTERQINKVVQLLESLQ